MDTSKAATALRAIGAGFTALADAVDGEPTEAADEFVAAVNTPHHRGLLDAIKAGHLAGFKPPRSRKVLVRRSDYLAWVERYRVGEAGGADDTEPKQDPVAAVIAMNANRRRRVV